MESELINNPSLLLEKLKNGDILRFMNPDAHYVSWVNDRVLVKGAQFRLHCEFEAFWENYQSFEFTIHQPKESELIDLEKDAEYYRWNH